MKRIIAFFIENSLLVYLGLIAIALMGVLLASRMNTSFFPNVDEKFIVIEAVYPGSSPVEVEEGITQKVEENLKGVSGIDRVTSVSSENAANIRVELESDVDADLVLQDVKNAVDQISTFPEGMERIVVYVEEIVNFTAKLALVGDVSLGTLEQTADRVEDELRAYPGISKISVSGYPDQEIEIAVEESKLRAFDLTFTELANAVSSFNIETTGGRIKGKEETIIRSDHKSYTANEMLDVVIKVLPDGKKLQLRDVAAVRDDWAENTDAGYFNGKKAVFITVNTLNEEDILSAADKIEKYVKSFNASNRAVEMVLVKDGTVNLKERIGLLQKNGIIGALIVFVLLALFLRIRLAFWVALGIPISFLGMFIFISFTGITINVLSLFGMILVIGILVDDGIVVGENIFQHYENGESRLKAVVNGTIEVLPAVISAILTTCIAFSFFFFIDGRLGEFFSDVSAVVIAALAFSLIEVLLFLPAHLAHTKDLTEDAKPNKLKDKVEKGLLKFRDRYFQPILDFSVQYKAFTFLVIFGVLILTFGALRGGVIRTTFFPDIEQNEIQVSLELPSGTSEEVTRETMNYIVNRIKTLDGKYLEREDVDSSLFENIEVRLGPQSNQGSATIYLVSSENRPIRSFVIGGDMREAVGAVPKAEKLSFATTTPFGKPVNISFSGQDFEKIRAAVADFKKELGATGNVKDLITNDRADQPELNISLNDAGRALGFTEQSLIGQVRNGFFGFEAQRLQRGDNEVKVWVRYAMEDRKEIEQLKNMRVRTPAGKLVALSDVATIEPTNGLIAINHRDGRREVTVEGEIASLDVSTPELIAQIQDEIMPPILGKYPGINVTYEGQQRDTAKLQKSISSVGPIILVLIFITLVVSFRSYSQTLALLLLIPFGIIGAAWGHFIHDQPLSILSFLGIIALVGVLLNDGLVYIGTFNQNLQEGLSFDDALQATSMTRFRPIVLTTVTTTAGLGPLILETSFQAQFLIPMAISIAYGLIVGSFLLVVLLPITLSIFNRIKIGAIWLWEKEKPSAEEVEQAIKRKNRERVKI